jgi:hypothetical protein
MGTIERQFERGGVPARLGKEQQLGLAVQRRAVGAAEAAERLKNADITFSRSARLGTARRSLNVA